MGRIKYVDTRATKNETLTKWVTLDLFSKTTDTSSENDCRNQITKPHFKQKATKFNNESKNGQIFRPFRPNTFSSAQFFKRAGHTINECWVKSKLFQFTPNFYQKPTISKSRPNNFNQQFALNAQNHSMEILIYHNFKKRLLTTNAFASVVVLSQFPVQKDLPIHPANNVQLCKSKENSQLLKENLSQWPAWLSTSDLIYREDNSNS